MSIKIFLASRSELFGRLDPIMILFNRKSNSFKFPATSLKSLLLCPPQYGANESGIERAEQNQPRYIRITDVDEFGRLNNTIGVTANKVEEKYILKNNDILFARSGATVGKSYLHKAESINYKCFFAGYMIRFIVDERKILADYLFAFTQTNTYKEWVKAVQRAAGQPNINAEEYKSLQIPLPNLDTQKEIVKIINEAYKVKVRKEAEAEALIAGIDSYISSELGVKIHKGKAGLEKRLFTTTLRALSGARIDPNFYSPEFISIYESVQQIRNDKLSNLVSFSNETWNQRDFFENDFPYIEISEINLSTGSINYINWLPKDKAPSRAKMIVRENDIIVSTTRPHRGAISFINSEHDGYIASTGFAVLRNLKRNNITKEYLFYILRTQICLQQILQRSSGGNYPAITTEELKNILIPVPSLSTQIKIVNYINEVHSQNRKLLKEAADILEKAKTEVESKLIN